MCKFLNFYRCGNSGRLGVIFNDTVKLPDPENLESGARIWYIAPIYGMWNFSSFCVQILTFFDMAKIPVLDKYALFC